MSCAASLADPGVERITVRQSAYLRNHLFAPLGMSETKTVDFIDEARDGPARGYVFAFGHPIRGPGGSLAGTSLLIITVRTVAILRNRRTVDFGG